jgi:hypothetical protein
MSCPILIYQFVYHKGGGVLTSGEDVETDLTTDRVCEAEMTEFLLESSNHGSSDLVFLLVSYHQDLEVGIAYTVELLEVVSLLCAGGISLSLLGIAEKLTWHFGQQGIR